LESEIQSAKIEVFQRVLKFLQFAKKIGSRRALAEAVFPGTAIDVDNLYRKKSYSPEMRREVSIYIEENCSIIEKNYVLSIVQGGEEQRYKDVSLERVVDTFLDGAANNISTLEPGRVADECANNDGKYLIFSASKTNRYRVATMRIFYKKGLRSYLPVYVTRRFSPGTTEGEVRGVFFQSGETAYALGKVKGAYHYRISKLNLEHRNIAEKDRTDFYGLRLSHSVALNRPFAYRVYAYQVKRGDRFKFAHDYIKEKPDFGSEIFDDLDIKIGPTIEAKIFGENSLTQGLSVHVADD